MAKLLKDTKMAEIISKAVNGDLIDCAVSRSKPLRRGVTGLQIFKKGDKL